MHRGQRLPVLSFLNDMDLTSYLPIRIIPRVLTATQLQHSVRGWKRWRVQGCFGSLNNAGGATPASISMNCVTTDGSVLWVAPFAFVPAATSASWFFSKHLERVDATAGGNLVMVSSLPDIDLGIDADINILSAGDGSQVMSLVSLYLLACK